MSYKDKEEQKNWLLKNIVRYSLTFNKTTDKNELKHFSKQKNKREYLLGLIKKDMK